MNKIFILNIIVICKRKYSLASQLGITTKNYSGYGFKWAYWTTTAVYEDYGCYIDLQSGAIVKDGSTNFGRYVRLAVTF